MVEHSALFCLDTGLHSSLGLETRHSNHLLVHRKAVWPAIRKPEIWFIPSLTDMMDATDAGRNLRLLDTELLQGHGIAVYSFPL